MCQPRLVFGAGRLKDIGENLGDQVAHRLATAAMSHGDALAAKARGFDRG
jgi:hypothetical protein